VVVVDFDAAHERTDNLLHAGPIEIIEALGDPGREVFEAADDEREIVLAFDRIEAGLMPLLEQGEAPFQPGNARLELGLVDDALGIAVDEL